MTEVSTVLPTSRGSRVLAACVSATLFLAACGSSSDDTATSDDSVAETDTETTTTEAGSESTDDTTDTTGDAESDESSMSGTAVDIGLFFDGALAEEVTTEDCTLSGGTESTCYRITISGAPVTYETGPFCPSTINDTAEEGGIWFDGDAVYDIDGDFISGLAELYDDENWLMYDEDGNVLVTETAEEFDLAARPDVDPSLENHCVEGRLEWLEDGEPITTTVLIPVEPVAADAASTSRANLGITLDGVVIAQSAPVDAILSAYTIAAFDDCGGHYNPFDGYHLHGAVGCSEVGEAVEGETPMFAYAIDGYPVHSSLEDPDSVELDECNGHTTDELGYHYHANDAAENLVLECLMGQTAVTEGGGDAGAPEGDAPEGGAPEDGPPAGGAPGEDGDRPEGPPPGQEEEG